MRRKGGTGYPLRKDRDQMEKFKIITSNVRWVRDRKNPLHEHYVLVVGNNQVVYFGHGVSAWHRGNINKGYETYQAGDWEAQYTGENEIGIFELEIDPENWKVYTFRSEFPGFEFEKPDTLESLYELSKEQEAHYKKEGLSFGHRGQQKLDGEYENLHYLWRGWRPSAE